MTLVVLDRGTLAGNPAIIEAAAKVVADAPPLTDDQLATIIAVIHPARGERA